MRTDDVVNKNFTRSFMGYDIEEVDLFLDEIIDVIDRYESEKREMLLAMEYLLNKLEKEQTMPIAEMKRAISVSAPKKSGEATAKKPGARAISREKSANAPKPVRAPKVARVSPAESQRDRSEEIRRVMRAAAQAMPPEEEGQNAAEAGNSENWLDELLVNLIEREKNASGQPTEAADAEPNMDLKETREAYTSDSDRPSQETQPRAAAAQTAGAEPASDEPAENGANDKRESGGDR